MAFVTSCSAPVSAFPREDKPNHSQSSSGGRHVQYCIPPANIHLAGTRLRMDRIWDHGPLGTDMQEAHHLSSVLPDTQTVWCFVSFFQCYFASHITVFLSLGLFLCFFLFWCHFRRCHKLFMLFCFTSWFVRVSSNGSVIHPRTFCCTTSFLALLWCNAAKDGSQVPWLRLIM